MLSGWVSKELTFGYLSTHYVTIIINMWCLDAYVAIIGLSDQYSAFYLSISIAWIICFWFVGSLILSTYGKEIERQMLCALSASGDRSCAHAVIDDGWQPMSPPHSAPSCSSLPAAWTKCREACGQPCHYLAEDLRMGSIACLLRGGSATWR
jgi:hypothetical protein